jgi:adenylate kinase family enzyme
MQLKIIIAGPAGSGKSAVAYRVQQLLIREGFLADRKDTPGEPDVSPHEHELRLNTLVNQGTQVTVETAITVPERRIIRT